MNHEMLVAGACSHCRKSGHTILNCPDAAPTRQSSRLRGKTPKYGRDGLRAAEREMKIRNLLRREEAARRRAARLAKALLEKRRKKACKRIQRMWARIQAKARARVIVDELRRTQKRIRVPQSDPDFLPQINRLLERAFPGGEGLEIVCRDAQPSVLGGRILAPSMFGYQRLAQYVIDPRTRPDLRVSLIWRTGAGKSLGVIRILENYFQDDRPKVLVFPTESVCTSFYTELALFENKYLEYAIGKIGLPVYSDERGELDADWLEAFRDCLKMKGVPHLAGKPGYLKAPLRTYTYTTAMGSAVRKRTDPLFKRKPRSANAYDNTIVVMDEAHNLVDPSRLKLPIQRKNLKLLTEELYSCANSTLLFMTATPVVSCPSQGDRLLDIIKGVGRESAENGAYVLFYDSYPMTPVYAPTAAPLKNVLSTMHVYVDGYNIIKMLEKEDQVKPPLKPERKLQYANLTTTDAYCKPKVRTGVQGMLEYAQKLYLIANHIRKQQRRVLVMIDGNKGFGTMHEILKLVVGEERVRIMKGKKKGEKKRNEENRAWFNQKPYKEDACMLAEASEFKEGVSFYGCTDLVVVNPPSNWTALKQMYGRVLRSCRSSNCAPLEIRVAVAKNGLFSKMPTADEVRVEMLKQQRDAIEPRMYRTFGQNAIGSDLLRAVIGEEDPVVDKMTEQDPLLLQSEATLQTMYPGFLQFWEPLLARKTSKKKADQLMREFHTFLCKFVSAEGGNPERRQLVNLARDRLEEDGVECRGTKAYKKRGKRAKLPPGVKTRRREWREENAERMQREDEEEMRALREKEESSAATMQKDEGIDQQQSHEEDSYKVANSGEEEDAILDDATLDDLADMVPPETPRFDDSGDSDSLLSQDELAKKEAEAETQTASKSGSSWTAPLTWAKQKLGSLGSFFSS